MVLQTIKLGKIKNKLLKFEILTTPVLQDIELGKIKIFELR